MRIDYYLSRVFHQLSFSALVGASIFDYIGALDMTVPLASKAIMWPGFVVLFTGLYNAGAAKPSRMGPAAKTWRMVVYGMKIPLYLLMTPLPAKLGLSTSPTVRLGACVATVMLASYAKFYREAAIEDAKKGE